MTEITGSNSETIDPAAWAYEVAQSRVHAYVKLIVHTLRALMRDKGPDIEISDAELARCTSLSERTVSRYRTLAEQEGWISSRIGSGRSKVTLYRISIPMQTLCELSERMNGLKKNQTVSPPLDEKRVTASRTNSQKVTDSLTAGPTTGQNKTVSRTDSQPLKKEIPPHPLKKKINNIYNNHPSIETARDAGAGEVQGLNGATSHIVEILAGWINPMMPDYKTAKGWLESSVSMYGGVVVRDSFAELEAKVFQGDIVARPIPLLTKICQRRKNEKLKVRTPDPMAKIYSGVR